MSKRDWLLGTLLFAAACGGDAKDAPPAVPSGTQQAKQPGAQPNAQAPKKGDPARAARLRELNDKKSRLEARVRDLKTARDTLIEKQTKEAEQLPQVSKFRRRYTQLMIDANKQAGLVTGLEKRLGELKGVAESAARGKLQSLRKDQADLDKQKQEIEDAWKRSLAEARLGKVEESPVKKDLDLVRAAKVKWFETTPAARRGDANEGARKIINNSFRAWLKEKPARKTVVAKVLKQPGGPKGKSPDNYDFTNLDFYILLELLEDSLDRQNIVVEKKELSESEQKLNAILVKIEAVTEKVHKAMQEGGDDLVEYDDLRSRLEGAQELRDLLAEQVASFSQIFQEVEATRKRHGEEENKATAAIDEAQKELRAVRAQIRKLGS